MKLRHIATVAASSLLIVTAACGGDDEAADSPLAAAIAAAMSSDDGALTNDPDEAKCAADKIVASIGDDRFTELGVTDDNVGDLEDIDFTDAELETVYRQMFSCTDAKQAMTEGLVESGLTQEQAECMAGELSEDDIIAGAIASESDDPEVAATAEALFDEAAAACGIG